MIFLSLSFSTLVFYLFRRKEGLLYDPYTFFYLAFLYYGYFIPCTMYVTGNYDASFSSYSFIVTENEINSISYILISGFVALSVGYKGAERILRFFFRNTLIDIKKDDTKFIDKINLNTLLSIVCILLVIGIVIFHNEISLTISGYSSKIAVRYEFSMFNFYYKIAVISVLILISYYIFYNQYYIIFTIIGLLFFSLMPFLFYSKELFIYAGIVGFVSAGRIVKKYQLLVFYAIVVFVVLFLFTVMPAFSVYRATGEFVIAPLDRVSLTFLYSDALGPFGALLATIRGDVPSEYVSLSQSMILWVPRALWPDRPFDVAEQFARFYIPDWSEGKGLGFSIFAEGVLRFGVMGGALLMLLVGAVFVGLKTVLYAPIGPRLRPVVEMCALSPVLFTLMRSPFSSIFTQMLQFGLPFVSIFLILRFFVFGRVR